ncbi:exoribonuclease-2 [Desulfobotulus alkaliphilus]|uniref:Exoribonuclease-2 n=1 Tax=Desulfobotulus alkaliphilus TaxID=622671 RepID=A0A562RJM1_9BACT|nr:ribonuclease catalytic domain-containing protein [Desulfobotulus alkaliphilus]TWI68606.1 exoribonuclease-2 [Desulfobotulus alkaliphilus]
MEPGKIVKYIDQQKIITAVVTENKKQRLRLLTETNREVNLSANRLSHISESQLDLGIPRDHQVRTLKETAERRRLLSASMDLHELWEVVHEEADWQDTETIASLCFPDGSDADAQSAVIRTMFTDRLYFKFGTSRFFPHSPEQVEQLRKQQQEAERRRRVIEDGIVWLKKNLDNPAPELPDELRPVAALLQDYIIFGDEASGMETTRQILSGIGGDPGEKLFSLFVRLGLWEQDENLLLKKFDVPTEFDTKTMEAVSLLRENPVDFTNDPRRRDLTGLRLMTIDGPSTLDYDDAISIEASGDYHIVGVHIIDVAHFVTQDSPLDVCALERGSSIYLPDARFSMLPPAMSEDLCSLKGGELRPAISVLMRIADYARVIDYEIVPSVIRVAEQLTYSDANRMIEEDTDIANLDRIARNFRSQRIMAGAVQISLPEVNIRVDEDSGEILISKIDRESSSRMLVAEMMIMGNAMMADFLKKNEMPAVFRSQPEPKNRLYKGDEGSLFQNLMQRRHLNRVVLTPVPEPHSGIGFPCYVTATSPIRKYWDLSTQRQLKAILGMEKAAGKDEIQNLFARLEQPMASVGRVQFFRKRYWLFKYLEGRIGQRERALVLEERRNQYQVLLMDYMLEWMLPVSSGIQLKPESEIEVVIQQASARRDQLSLYLA